MTNRDAARLAWFLFVFAGILVSLGHCQNVQRQNSLNARTLFNEILRHASEANLPPELLEEKEKLASREDNGSLVPSKNPESSFSQLQRLNASSRQKDGGGGRNHKKRRRKSKATKGNEEVSELKEQRRALYSTRGTRVHAKVRRPRKKFQDERRRRRKNRDRSRERKASTPLCFRKVGESWTVFTRSDASNVTECKNATDAKVIRQMNYLASNRTMSNETLYQEPIESLRDDVEKVISRKLGEEISRTRSENEKTTQRSSNVDDLEKMLGYERTAEDLPILDLEKEVLERIFKDYRAYMSSNQYAGKLPRDREPGKRPKETRIPDVPMALRRGQNVTSQQGDLSCVDGTFLPAPLTRHALIKYVKSSSPGSEYLEANYECAPGYNMTTNSSRLLCKNRRWVGEVPKCKVKQNPNELCAELSCEQVCKEFDGQAICSCFEGFLPDGRSCLDIDECEKSNGGCEYKCENTPGSYQCECPEGMRQEDKYSCVDIDECVSSPCQGTCRNIIGSYECSCDELPDTVLSPDNHTCQDANPCNYNNAGCSHTCLSTMGRVFCLCPDGFMLEDNWKTCQDIDECAVADLQTENCRYGCVNTPGSYRCIDNPSDQLVSDSASMVCPVGFEVSKSGSCLDINECATDNGGCSEICENTNGSFFCACEGDERTMSADGKFCIELGGIVESCPSLNPTGRGVLVCSQSSKTEQHRQGSKCFLKCPPRYQLHGEYELTCQLDGTWDGPKHGECVKYSKPRLDCPKDVVAEVPIGRDEAFVTFDQPSTDLDWFRYVRSKPSWGTRLEANLKPGVHEITFYARHPVSKKQTTCVLRITIKDGEAPKVKDCPSDIEVRGGNGSTVSWTEPTFSDNVNVARISKSAGPGQKFDVGGHKVEYEASDEAGWTTKCTFTVLVRQQ